MNDVKPGYKTTEFWLANAAFLVSTLMASGAFVDGWIAQILGALGAVLTSMGYSIARGQAKKPQV